MLSPGKWHQQVPKDPLGNRQFRLATLKKARTDRGLQQGLIHACRQDLLFYINTFVFQYNPLKKGAEAAAPFLTWPFQEQALLAAPERPDFQSQQIEYGLLWCYEHERNAVVEKSRILGITWLFLILQDWLCLFHPYVQTLNISRNEDAVDDKSPDSLFWRLRFMHEHLPAWLIGHVDDSKLFLGFQRTKSVITGQASTGRAGVGGRAGLIFVDECAHIREMTEVRRRTANTTDCRFFNSTHEGVGTEFYKLTQTPEMVKITLHWSQHPEHSRGLYYSRIKNGKPDIVDTGYQFPHDFKFVLDGSPTGGPYPGLRSPWYDKKCDEIGSPHGVASQLDINPTGSVSQFFDPQLVRELQDTYAIDPMFQGDLAYDPYTGRPAREGPLVSGPGGPLRLWLHPDHRGRIPAERYAFGADVATGQGGRQSTPSCLSGIRCKDGVKILEYANPFIEPTDFATLSVAVCWLFKDEDGQGAQLAWERQGPGEKFGKQVLELGYRNIYWMKDEGNPSGRKKAEDPGFSPKRQTTRLLMEDYKRGLSTRQIVNHSREALEELLYWRYAADGGIEHTMSIQKGDPSGAGANHGDRSVADALAWLLARGLGAQIKKQEETRARVGTLQWRRELAEAHERQQGDW